MCSRTPTNTLTVPSWEWLIPPEWAGPYRIGFLVISVGRARDFYRCTLRESDDFAELWAVEKQQTDGSYQDAYLVSIPVGGAYGPVSCTCPGWVYNRTCRHALSLPAALEWQANNGAKS